jgi:pimeloyl-ACP methyl ester carboxylesterase
LTRFPDELEKAEWNYGSPLNDIKRLVARWQDGFDWRAAETEINELPMFTTPVAVGGFGELDIHFVHKRSPVDGAIPLLFVHGWPGHFLEVSKILDSLTSPDDPRQPAFHVVAPSLPNFGFSEGIKQKGFRMQHYAEVCNNLMQQLGYRQYVTQGGDWGSFITRKMAVIYGGKTLRAFHNNLLVGRPPSKWTQPLLYWTPLSAEEKRGLQRSEWFEKTGSGYFRIQTTKPQTLGYGLADSPVGLLAWIYEKLVEWTDGYPWTDDEILTWVSIYWFSRAGPAASVRIYYETVQSGDLDLEHHHEVPRHVPMGASYFPKELQYPPSSYVRAAAWVVHESRHQKGGHFAAYEQPVALVGDLRAMFGRDGPAFAVVKTATGYPLKARL